MSLLHLPLKKCLPLLAALNVALGNGFAAAQELKAPANAQSPSKLTRSWPLPSPHALRGPMFDSKVGRSLIQVETDPPVNERGAGGESLERLFAARCRSVVFIAHRVGEGENASVATGTGSIITIEGHVLTAAHVVEGSEVVAVGVFPSCKPGAQPEYYPARVVRADKRTDLALLVLTKMPSDIAVMPLGQLDDVRSGSNVVMIGHPRQLMMSLSQGLVSAVRPDYAWQASDSVSRRATVIQTDGALNPGNSGGPMMSSDGNLVGVNSFIFGQASSGLNFAVSVADVRSFLSGSTSASSPSTAPSQAPSPARSASNDTCKAKVMREWHEGSNRYALLDMDCKGKANGILTIPDDKTSNSILGKDRNGDGKIDVRIYLNASNQPVNSEWDDDYDGKFDFRGEHANGEWQPSRKVRLAGSTRPAF